MSTAGQDDAGARLRAGDGLMSTIVADVLVQEAEAYTAGYRRLHVAHGVPETPDEEERLRRLRDAIDGRPDAAGLVVVGTTDTTTWWWPPDEDGRAQDDVVRWAAELARDLDPRWWRIDADT